MRGKSNHEEFLRLSRELYETQDSNRAREISLRLKQLNQDYFGIFPDVEVKVPAS